MARGDSVILLPGCGWLISMSGILRDARDVSEHFTTPDAGERFDSIVRRFADAWERGEPPRLEPLLEQSTDQPDQLLARLLPIELQARQRLGTPLSRDQCRARFPRFQAIVDRLFLDPPDDSVPELAHDASTDDRPDPLTSVASGARDNAGTRDNADSRDHDAFSLLTDDLATKATTGPSPDPNFPRIDGFEILDEIGRGGMGIVYRAREVKHGRTVALKTMLRVDPAAISRFKQEFRTRAGIYHHNLVRLHELVVTGRFAYFTMELVEGQNILRSLRGDLAAGRPLPEQRLDVLADALRQICDGLMALHAAGKVHRDIKSGNVLITDEGRVVIVDFGLAIELGHEGTYQTLDGHVIGTPTFMSPEQAAGTAVTPATDCYALGVLLYAALTGQLPFEGRTAEVIRRKCDEDPLPPEERVGGVPERFSRICMRLLTRDPDKRGDIPWVLGELGSPQRPAAAPRSDPPFVGRESELRALLAGFGRLRERQPSAHFIRGLSGSGKSKLVALLVDDVRRHADVLVLQSRCYGQESLPFKAIDELIEGLTRHLRELTFEQVDALLPRNTDALAQVFPTLRQVDAVRRTPRNAEGHLDRQSLRNKAFLALREMLARIGDRRRLLLIIDDLQWSDHDSLVLLNRLLRGPDPPNLMFVGIFREEEFRETVYGAITDSVPSCHRSDLGPLSLSDCERLFESMVPPGNDPQRYAALRSQIASESLGSPLFLRELALAVTEGGRSLAAMGDVTLDAIMWSRIENLASDSRHVLRTIAVAGQPMRLDDLAGITGVDASQAAESIEALHEQSLARKCGGDHESEWDTFHDRVREVILAKMTSEERRERHRAIAEYAESNGENNANFLAIHYRLAGHAEKSSTFFALAADGAAAKLAFHQAAEFYQEAIELGKTQGGQLDTGLRAKLAEALSNSGQCLRAAEIYLKLADETQGAASIEMRRRAFTQFQFMGQLSQARDALKVLCEQIGREIPVSIPQALARTVLTNLKILLVRCQKRRRGDPTDGGQVDAYWSIASAMTHVDFVRSSYFTAQHLLEAEKLGDPARLARALGLEAGVIASLGRVTRRHSRRLSRRADTLANDVDDDYVKASLALCRGIRSGCLGQWAKSLHECHEAETKFVALRQSSAIRNSNESHEILGSMTLAQFWQLMSMTWLGEIEQLHNRCDRLIDDAVQRGDLFSSAMLGGYCRSFLRVAEDRPIDGLRELQSTIREWNDGGFYIQHHLAVIGEATLRMYRGEAEGVVALIRRHRRPYRQSWFLGAHVVRAQLNDLLARAALAQAFRIPNRRRILRRANGARRRLSWEGLPWTSALSLAYRGLSRLALGQANQAARDLKIAAERFESAGMVLHAAASRARLADATADTSAVRLRQEAFTAISQKGIARPLAFVNLLMPGPTIEDPQVNSAPKP